MTDYAGVLQQVNEAETFPSGPIQDLHLDVAQTEWTQLAAAAQQLQ